MISPVHTLIMLAYMLIEISHEMSRWLEMTRFYCNCNSEAVRKTSVST